MYYRTSGWIWSGMNKLCNIKKTRQCRFHFIHPESSWTTTKLKDESLNEYSSRVQPVTQKHIQTASHLSNESKIKNQLNSSTEMRLSVNPIYCIWCDVLKGSLLQFSIYWRGIKSVKTFSPGISTDEQYSFTFKKRCDALRQTKMIVSIFSSCC